MNVLQSLLNAADKAAVAEANFEKLDTRIYRGSAALDFGSIADGVSADLTIPVTGAVVGDVVHLALPAAPTAGIVFQAFVSATNTVTVRATNVLFTGAIDPGSATYNVIVMRY